jgi:hypothetical protein
VIEYFNSLLITFSDGTDQADEPANEDEADGVFVSMFRFSSAQSVPTEKGSREWAIVSRD